ncbi:uncharacterized protein EDB93DRAFT_1113906 [Suillus bovinus]|uniref:uncharacterized protein n=1 Tax=Suillus bovinus TaxID=48563 RepID=UPI001B8775DE|nr:uncharacterized protein EDB93DRAFT_1113906 [Suillus bovinus]KAG2160195.1 hypothetical protein EDB93DRAFT_1113906 [Suillus bovinus]
MTGHPLSKRNLRAKVYLIPLVLAGGMLKSAITLLNLPSLGRYVPPLIPQFVPAAGNRGEFRVGAEVQMYDGRSQPYSGPYQWQYTHNNNYMDHDA